jgi:hypothetical protein
MRVTKARKKFASYDINVRGERVGSAHNANGGPVWYVSSDKLGLQHFNSALAGLCYADAAAAADAAVAYVKAALKQGSPQQCACGHPHCKACGEP